MTELKTDKFYYAGTWMQPAGQDRMAVVNPATEAPVAEIALGNAEDVDRAVMAAVSAFEGFSRTSKAERLELLASIRAVYARRQDEMAAVITSEMGAPIRLSKNAQAAVGIGHLDGFVQALEHMEFEYTNLAGDLIVKEPIGVVGLITPWNWPINQIALKVLAALAAGCTMVLKPSELTPLSGLLYAEILDEAGMPPGVFNLVNGTGPEVGAALSKHPDIAMMSFTGSTRAGRQISIDAAANIKRVALELGGKSPNILLEDCDVEAAVSQGCRAVFSNTGQSCNAPTRMLVPASLYERAKEVAQATAEATEVGDPAVDGRHIGPLASDIQFEKVQALIQQGIDEGATLLAGGTGRPNGMNHGYYVRPTVFADVTNDMTIAQEEIFGPVLAMIPYADEDEAVRLANDTPYGLAAYVQSADVDRAMAVGRRLRAGMVRLNGSDIDYGSPFGGYKMSGNGREGGEMGIEDFLETKCVSRP
ncbi:aldehyde dehydrogenase family protein [Mangrovicoccus algicola]|uniref:aldehyde dehydrogenase (NAD(+)) n=1 Tax=Mangrovicoccus algicola TaxID=2771008 RepID=A0A8J7CYJ1_9RHOB|nr:aldehyde dehydrogenase family protein [Mangrovicoccus algicola]MBE3636598.1 aldehyde dehydrogenase family protein [Mangrovicoccus algicola]